MEQLLPALLTGTVIGAVVTGAITLLKPVLDYWISLLQRRYNRRAEQTAVVEGVVERLRKLRVDHVEANREGRAISYPLVLEAADTALLIHNREFAKYLSLDIENTSGYSVLYEWHAELGEIDDNTTASSAAREARWDHLKMLVERASEFAVTGKWEKKWAAEAIKLSEQMAIADASLDR
ncbi:MULTISPECIES: hypothetical protein [unclassified Microbacterium]|uniref:hypothetical protein n=1 Tax=unclassified Microbacterium TaxID=2609290 RepID=UPI00288333BA|nr:MULTISPECIES: hypothetical protein [unclassified Microbacterium]